MKVRSERLRIDSAGHEIAFKLIGEAEQTIVCLHGGPGSTMSYLEPFEAFAGPDLQVLLYDQLGGGDSDRPDDDSLWRVDRFVEELDVLREALGIERFSVFGRSWGAMLGLQYTLDHPERVASLVFTNAGASAIQMARSIKAARLRMPDQMVRRMWQLERDGRFEDPEYEDLVWEFNGRYMRRNAPFDPATSPAEARALLGDLFADHGPPYRAMWGPNEFVITGNLLDWDVTDRLGEVSVPTLVLAGMHDEQGLDTHAIVAEGIPGAEFVIFGQSSHLVLLEREAGPYMDVIRGFLKRVYSPGGTALP